MADILRYILLVIVYPFAFCLSMFSYLISYLNKYFHYVDISNPTVSEYETEFIHSQSHDVNGPNRIQRYTYRVPRPGSLEYIKKQVEYLDPPIEGYVQIKVHAIGLNFADIFAVQGLYSATPPPPFIPGLEFSGEVIALPRVTATGASIPSTAPPLLIGDRPVAIGDRVAGVIRFGAFTTVLNADVQCLMHIPPSWSYEAAASVIVQGLTAAYALFDIARLPSQVNPPLDSFPMIPQPAQHHLPFVRPHQQLLSPETSGALFSNATNNGAKPAVPPTPPSDHLVPRHRPVVLIHSAAGGVGIHALRMVLAIGGIPICTVTGRKKREYLVRKFGLKPEQVIDRSVCGELRVRHFPSRIGSGIHHYLKHHVKSIFRFVFSPIRGWLDRTICHRRKTAKDFGLLLEHALHSVQVEHIDVVLDSLLGPFFQPVLDRIASGGHIVVFGAGTYSIRSDFPDWLHIAYQYMRRPVVDPMSLIPSNATVTGFNLIWLWERVNDVPRLMKLLQHVINKPLPVNSTYTFDTLPDALRHLQSGKTIGKVVVRVQPQHHIHEQPQHQQHGITHENVSECDRELSTSSSSSSTLTPRRVSPSSSEGASTGSAEDPPFQPQTASSFSPSASFLPLRQPGKAGLRTKKPQPSRT